MTEFERKLLELLESFLEEIDQLRQAVEALAMAVDVDAGDYTLPDNVTGTVPLGDPEE